MPRTEFGRGPDALRTALLSPVRRQYRPAHRRSGVADKESDHACDRLRRDRVRHHLHRERGPRHGSVDQLRRDRVHPDPVLTQLGIQNAGQVDNRATLVIDKLLVQCWGHKPE